VDATTRSSLPSTARLYFQLFHFFHFSTCERPL
jgi:hypothetical protein